MSFAATVGSILANRYISGTSHPKLCLATAGSYFFLVAGVAALLYDHALTFEDEIFLIWLNSAGGIGNRLGFIVNRYMTEALALYVVYGKSPADRIHITFLDLYHSAQRWSIQCSRKSKRSNHFLNRHCGRYLLSSSESTYGGRNLIDSQFPEAVGRSSGF